MNGRWWWNSVCACPALHWDRFPGLQEQEGSVRHSFDDDGGALASPYAVLHPPWARFQVAFIRGGTNVVGVGVEILKATPLKKPNEVGRGFQRPPRPRGPPLPCPAVVPRGLGVALSYPAPHEHLTYLVVVLTFAVCVRLCPPRLSPLMVLPVPPLDRGFPPLTTPGGLHEYPRPCCPAGS